MKRLLTITLAAAVAAIYLQAQNANPLSTEVKQAYTNTKNKILCAAEKMPEEHYSFKATPDVRTFGGWIAHVADANVRNCAAVNGEQKTGNAASKTSKADLTAALKESFADCDKAYDSLTDANATEMTKGQRPRTKLGALAGNTAHDEEAYGSMAVYMRLKGLVPPSSEGR